MLKNLRIAAGIAAISLPHGAIAQTSPFLPPLPGTPVPPIEIPAHVAKSFAPPAEKPANRRVINSTTAQIDYRINTFGPTGIGRVEIWLTADDGEHWYKAGEDADMQSPAAVSLPGEGVFGVRLAIFNGAGFGRTPRDGERPQTIVEVDVAAPRVALQECAIVPEAAAIDIRWSASDANFSAEPIRLSYRDNPAAPWRVIVPNAKNDGAYRWRLPPDIGPRVEVKVDAVDVAGNTSSVQSPTPVLLDQTEPEAVVVGATAIARTGTALIPVSIPSASSIPEQPLPITIMPRTMPAATPSR
jgi:hypothetical protein